jgi:DNA-binding NtrC family response regulator
MMSHLFIFEPKPDISRKLTPVWEHRFTIHEIDLFPAMEAALLSRDAGSAVIIFNWDKWAKPLAYLQKIRIWHRLIPIVVVSSRMSTQLCLEALREQLYTCLPKPLMIADLGAVLDCIFDDYDMVSLRNMYYLSIRKRKFVFNKTMRYQDFQVLARALDQRETFVPPVVSDVLFALPKPVILVLDRDVQVLSELTSYEDRYTVLVAETADEALLCAAAHPDIALVVIDVALPGMLDALISVTMALPKAGVLVWTDSQDRELAITSFQVGVFDYVYKSEAASPLCDDIDRLLQMKWEMDAGGDIALYTRQFLFAAHCRYAFQQRKPVYWSDWYLFFHQKFPEKGFQTAPDTPIPNDIFETLGIAQLSVLAPTAYPEVFGEK